MVYGTGFTTVLLALVFGNVNDVYGCDASVTQISSWSLPRLDWPTGSCDHAPEQAVAFVVKMEMEWWKTLGRSSCGEPLRNDLKILHGVCTLDIPVIHSIIEWILNENCELFCHVWASRHLLRCQNWVSLNPAQIQLRKGVKETSSDHIGEQSLSVFLQSQYQDSSGEKRWKTRWSKMVFGTLTILTIGTSNHWHHPVATGVVIWVPDTNALSTAEVRTARISVANNCGHASGQPMDGVDRENPL